MILSLCPNPSVDTYAWLPHFHNGSVNRIERIEEFPGGKGTHVALALAELGERVDLYGLWAGFSGQWIQRACHAKGVDTTGITIEGNNRKCYTFRSDSIKFNHSELLEPGPELLAAKWSAMKKDFQQNIKAANLLTFSGSWPKGAPTNAYAELIDLAKNNQKPVILDCSGVQLEAALQTGFFGIHLNEHEAINLCGSSQIHDLIQFLDGKVELIALSLGKKGLQLYANGQVLQANVEIDHVISTVGSGDCLTAGIAYAIEKQLPPEEIARYGVACGATNCLTEELGMIKKQTVETLLSRVDVKTL